MYRLFIIYLVSVNSFLIFILITAFIPAEVGVECSDKVASWQWLVITSLDTLQTAVLATTGIMMFKHD